ncbi:MAG: PEP-CTERM sorting domain-containing protein [Cyanobacterium sp.]
MKIKSTTQLFGLGLGTALGSLALMSAPAFSASLNFFGTDEDIFLLRVCEKSNGTPNDPGCNNIRENVMNSTKTEPQKQQARNLIAKDLQIGEVQGFSRNITRNNLTQDRPQGLDTVYFGKDGSNSLISGLPLQSKEFSWISGETANWELDWNPDTEKATFTIRYLSPLKEESLSYDYSTTITDFKTFNSLALITFVNQNRIRNGVSNLTSALTISEATFNDDPDNPTIQTNFGGNSSVISTSTFDKLFFILDDESLANGVNITNLKGTYTMSWDGGGSTPGQLAAGFYLRMVDPQSTPEPGLMLGLLGVGALGLVSKKRKIEEK